LTYWLSNVYPYSPYQHWKDMLGWQLNFSKPRVENDSKYFDRNSIVSTLINSSNKQNWNYYQTFFWTTLIMVGPEEWNKFFAENTNWNPNVLFPVLCPLGYSFGHNDKSFKSNIYESVILTSVNFR